MRVFYWVKVCNLSKLSGLADWDTGYTILYGWRVFDVTSFCCLRFDCYTLVPMSSVLLGYTAKYIDVN